LVRRIAAFCSGSLALSVALAASADAPPPAGKGPVVELAPEDQAPPAKAPPLVSLGTGRTVDRDLARSLAEPRFQSAAESLAHTAIGGYGEISVSGVTSAGNSREWTADARRLVLFVAHSFTPAIRVYTELELEHAKEAEIEQAYLDWKVVGDYLGLRAGLLLVPMGITNEVHEPPAFNGVARPSVETVVIPTTWREVGAGFFGRPVEPLRYQLYAVAGLDPLGFSAGGFATASGAGVIGKAKAWAAAGRLEWEPLLGVIVAASGYASDAGQNGDFHHKNKAVEDLVLPVVGLSIDARVRRAGIEAKVLYTEWRFPNTGALMHAYDAYGNLIVADPKSPVPSALRGMYAELGYDVFARTRVSHQLVPFVRVEAYDTQAAVPQGFRPNLSYDVREVTVGASYRPIREVVVKADYQLRHHETGAQDTLIDVGVGFMY
jgi:hypothetical protein